MRLIQCLFSINIEWIYKFEKILDIINRENKNTINNTAASLILFYLTRRQKIKYIYILSIRQDYTIFKYKRKIT